MPTTTRVLSKILLIDDDAVTNFLNEFILREKLAFQGEIRICANGKEALDYLFQMIENSEGDDASFMPDLIFLDINMPVMDGFDFLISYKNIQEFYRENSVIYALTSSMNPFDRSKILEIGGVSNFITKPLTEDVLKGLIDGEFVEAFYTKNGKY